MGAVVVVVVLAREPAQLWSRRMMLLVCDSDHPRCSRHMQLSEAFIIKPKLKL